MGNKPFFSIVMPTRNRANLLPIAIQSALRQTFEDFELIVSDNFSDDNTGQVVKGFDDPRIKYIKTGSFLPINESWEFGISHAHGEYVAFLCDDDVYSKIYLESFEREIGAANSDVIACGMPQYYENPHYETRHKFISPHFTNESYVYDCKRRSAAVLQYMFAKGDLTEFPYDFGPKGLPYLSNAAYRANIFVELKRSLSSVFPRNLASTDVYSSAIILSQLTDKYSYLDKPLYIQRVSDVSLTRSPNIDDQKRTYGKPTHDMGVYQDHFLDFAYSNRWIEACLLAVSDAKVKLNFELSWAKYYINAFDSIKYLQNQGFDMSIERKSFWKTLGKQDRIVRDEVRSVIATPRMRLSDLMRRAPIIGYLLRAKDKYRQSEDDLVGLDDPLSIGQYADMIDENFLRAHCLGIK